MLALKGDPLWRETLVMRPKGFGFEDPNKGFEKGLRSCGGDAVKHSSSDGVLAVEKQSTPAPNLNGGSGLVSRDLKDTVLVE